MSGEFGWCPPGYIHHVIAETADMCDNGKYEMTRAFAAFLESIVPVVTSIAYAESDDTSIDTAMQDVSRNLPRIQEALSSLQSFIEETMGNTTYVCRECGYEFEQQLDTCPRCGSFDVVAKKR